MNKTLMKLSVWGCDVKDALPRFLKDEKLMHIMRVSAGHAFETLGRCLQVGDITDAFDAVTLKGVLGNTGLTPQGPAGQCFENRHEAFVKQDTF